MNQTLKIAGAIVCVILAVLAVARLVVKGGDAPGQRDASRVFACQLCGEVNLLDAEMIRAQYDNGQVKPGPQGAVFVCPSCGKQGALSMVLDFDSALVRCDHCGEVIADDETAAKHAIAGDQAKLDDQHRLSFYCAACDGYFGHMVPRETPPEEN